MKRWTCFGVAFAALLAPTAQAIVSEYLVQVSVDSDVKEDRVVNEAAGLITQTAGAMPFGFAEARANLELGVNKTYSHIAALDETASPQIIYAFASSSWWDTVTISDPNLDGTAGSFTASLNITGSGSVEMSPSWVSGVDPWNISLHWLALIEVTTDGGLTWQNDPWYGDWFQDVDNGTLFYEGFELNQIMPSVTFDFIFGQPFVMGATLQSDLFVLANDIDMNQVAGTVNGTIDLGHSAHWAGMGNVRDAQGNLVSTYGFHSDSGIDWRNPVPEPASLAVVGLGLIAILRRRR